MFQISENKIRQIFEKILKELKLYFIFKYLYIYIFKYLYILSLNI